MGAQIGSQVVSQNSSSQQQVAINGLPVPGSGQSVKVVGEFVNAGAAGSTTIYTVTGGKTFYMTGLHLTSSTANTIFKITDNGADSDPVANTPLTGIVGQTGAANTPMTPALGNIGIPFATNVKLRVNVAANVYIAIEGFEA